MMQNLVHMFECCGINWRMTTNFWSPARPALGFCFALTVASCFQLEAATRVLPEGQLPNDDRLKPLKDLDGYFPFNPPASQGDWEKRAERVRRQILVSQGLWPMPTRTPMNPVIHGKIEREEYTVEKVYFESAPGFFVTGNLYRPKKTTGKVPGVLFAHGHWENARLAEATDPELRREIANGEERFEVGGKSRFQSMCVQLARMGCVVWQWDMLGDSDSQQLSRQLVHGFAKQRPEMNSTENWGLFSPEAEAHLQSAMGLQTWNSMRSLDFLLSLPEVDPERVAMTGASGGGTQTMILAGIDPRLKLSFPAVMVSTAMQGGCTCENSSLLRVGTGNVEFAALFAPKPQGMTCANDWTKEMSTKGFPELQQLYKLLGAPDNVMLKRGEHFPHNYNAVSRSAFYGALNRHFDLGQKEPVIERDYQRLGREELTVWDDRHPAPRAADQDFERMLLSWLSRDAAEQIERWHSSPNEYRTKVAGAVEVMVGRNMEQTGDTEWDMKHKQDHDSYIEMSGLLRNKAHGEELPVVFLHPKQWNRQTVIWADDSGKSSLFTADGSPRTEVQKLLKAGATVMGVDLLYQGEFAADGQPLKQTPRVKNPREAAAFTFGYNSAICAQRTHDLMTVISYMRGNERKSERIDLVGFGEAVPSVVLARLMAGETLAHTAIDTGGFRFGKVLEIHSPQFLPGGAKYDDVPGLLLAGGTQPLWLAGEPEAGAAFVRSGFQRENAQGRLTVASSPSNNRRAAAVDWLLSAAAR